MNRNQKTSIFYFLFFLHSITLSFRPLPLLCVCVFGRKPHSPDPHPPYWHQLWINTGTAGTATRLNTTHIHTLKWMKLPVAPLSSSGFLEMSVKGSLRFTLGVRACRGLVVFSSHRDTQIHNTLSFIQMGNLEYSRHLKYYGCYPLMVLDYHRVNKTNI